jgi:alpha-mannosidase
MSAGCCTVTFQEAVVSPLLVSTTYCRGDAYYWTYNRGRHEFTFSLHTHDGDWQQTRHYGIGWEQWSPLRVVRGQPRLVSVPHRACLPDRREYLRCDHPAVAVTAFKTSYDGNGHAVRLFNASSDSVKTKLHLGVGIAQATLCDMNEQVIKPVSCESNTMAVSLGPHEIATYLLHLAELPPSPAGRG